MVWDWSRVRDDSPLLKRIIAIRDMVCQLEGSKEAAMHRFASWTEGTRLCLAKVYEFFRPKGTKIQWVKEVWNNFVTPKHAFCLWLTVKRKWLTKDRLFISVLIRGAFCAIRPMSRSNNSCSLALFQLQFGIVLGAGLASLGP